MLGSSRARYTSYLSCPCAGIYGDQRTQQRSTAGCQGSLSTSEKAECFSFVGSFGIQIPQPVSDTVCPGELLALSLIPLALLLQTEPLLLHTFRMIDAVLHASRICTAQMM
jgi:hypothetical protein